MICQGFLHLVLGPLLAAVHVARSLSRLEPPLALMLLGLLLVPGCLCLACLSFPGIPEYLPPGLRHIVQDTSCDDDQAEVPLGYLEAGHEEVPAPFQLAKGKL